MDILMRREKIVHDYEVYFPAPRQLHTMQTIEPREKCVRVVLDVKVIVLQNRS